MSDEAVVRELYRRRDTLDAEQRAVVDELAKRMGLSAPPDPGVLTGLYETTVKPLADVVSGLVSNPMKTILDVDRGITDAMFYAPGRYMEQAIGAAGRGDVMGAIRYAPGMVPILGPMAESLTDMVEAGQPRRAMGQLLGTILPSGRAMLPARAAEAIPTLGQLGQPAKRFIGEKFMGNVNNPVVEGALQYLEPDVPMTIGQRTGQTGLNRIEQGLQAYPGSSTQAHNFYAGQAEALARKAESLASRQGGTPMDAAGAGEAILRHRLVERQSRLRDAATRDYATVEDMARKNAKTVQVGTVQSPIVDASGNPFSSPVFETFELPVRMEGIRNSLRPVYDDIVKGGHEAELATNPAFNALRRIVQDKDEIRSAMDLDMELSAIKALARKQDNPYLSSKSRRTALEIVAREEKALQGAVADAGGSDAVSTLQRARSRWRAQVEVADLRWTLERDPAALYQKLTRSEDLSQELLTTLSRIAPHEVKAVGQTFLRQMIEKATRDGGFGRAKGVKADFHSLGPRTKRMLFGETLPGEIEQFLLGAEKLTENLNPSGSGSHVLQHLISSGAGGGVGSLLAGNFGGAAGAVAGLGVTMYAYPRVMANLLLDHRNLRMFNQAMKHRPGSPAFRLALSSLNSRLGQQLAQEAAQNQEQPAGIASPEN